MSIWKIEPTLEMLNNTSHQTINQTLGIEFTEVGPDYLIAKMPIDHRTCQPMGILHGGASGVLAETLGSVASVFCIDAENAHPVGIELNLSHLNAGKPGTAFGRVEPIRVGRKIHVWKIDLHDANGVHLCTSRLTVAVVSRK